MRTYHIQFARSLVFSELISRSTMESTLLAAPAAMSLVALSKSLSSNSAPLVCNFQRRFSMNRASQIVLLSRIARAQLRSGWDPTRFGSFSLSKSLKSGDSQPVRRELRSVSRSAASFAPGGGGNDGLGGNGGGGGGGGGAADGAKENPSAIAASGEDASALSSDVIILDVTGMTCGGCAASVKRILESRPQVSSASVNLTAETAIVWPVSEAKVVPNWQQQLGEELAKHLTNCGFKSNVRGQGAIEGETPS